MKYMEIAKGIEDEDYKKLNLSINDLNNKNWDMAFDYLEKRLLERFIEPVNLLIESEKNLKPKDKKFGFSILAIDFLLSETLQSFYEGEINSLGKSTNIFARFLTVRNSFKPYFESLIDGKSFYWDFRCEILHQAQTSSDTKVWTVGKLIEKNGRYTIVNRDEYHRLLLKEINEYFKKLRTKKDIVLLKNFKTKMDFICGISSS